MKHDSRNNNYYDRYTYTRLKESCTSLHHYEKCKESKGTRIKLTPSEAKENLLALCWCSFSVEDFHQHQIEHNSLECHPSKSDQEEVM